MSSWKGILEEINEAKKVHDNIRRKYLNELFNKTERNIIIYYSGWLQKSGMPGLDPLMMAINDSDKIGFMTAIHKLDRSKGLDLILHTPGGGMASTEALVNYLRQMFGTNIRAIIPELALSGGTMIACACKSIVMGKQSNLGPIDPQIGGLPAHGIIEEFNQAKKECFQNQICIPLWQPIIAKYTPTLIGEAEKAINWSEEMVKEWLMTGMFIGEDKAKEKSEKIIKEIGDHALTKSHSRHLSAEFCKNIGLKIEMMEDDQELQDAILTLHHACIHTLTETPTIKIIENHIGNARVTQIKNIVAQYPPQPYVLEDLHPKDEF